MINVRLWIFTIPKEWKWYLLCSTHSTTKIFSNQFPSNISHISPPTQASGYHILHWTTNTKGLQCHKKFYWIVFCLEAKTTNSTCMMLANEENRQKTKNQITKKHHLEAASAMGRTETHTQYTAGLSSPRVVRPMHAPKALSSDLETRAVRVRVLERDFLILLVPLEK